MTIDVEEYVSSFRPEMMDFAADWCNGATFKDIQKRSDFFEVNKCLMSLFSLVVDSVNELWLWGFTARMPLMQGSLVRAIRRIEEVLRQLVAAAKGIGDNDLAAKFEEATERIKRGVVFAGSLYL